MVFNYLESLLITARLSMALRDALNVSARKVGGIWFLRAGRFSVSACITQKPITR